jgi:hypothetical protein
MAKESVNREILIADKIVAENKEWIELAQYLLDRDKGLRKQAFIHLNEFLKSTENWTEEQKIKFTTFLMPFFETDSYLSFPQPLSEKLVKPTLEKWCLKEMTDSRPFRWYGKFYSGWEYLKKALEINPQDEQARQFLIEKGIYRLYFAVHHMPEGYIADSEDEVKEDLALIDELQNHISKLSDIKLQRLMTSELENYAELVKNYVEWKKSGHSDLEKWGEENHKRVSLGVRVYYYEK